MGFRALFAIAACYDLDMDQIDIKPAFLYGIIKQLIYVKLPPVYEKEGVVCRLLKGLHGVKQSARLWYEKVSGHLFLREDWINTAPRGPREFRTKGGIHGPMIRV